MESFRINFGRCIVTEDSLYIEKSVRGFIHRIYEGSKLFFAGLVFVVLFLAVVTVAAGPVDAGLVVLVGTLIGLTVYFGIAAVNYARDSDRQLQYISQDTEIPLNNITSVEFRDSGIFPKIHIEYQKGNETTATRITFPYRFFSFTEEEFAMAQSIFEDRGLPIKQRPE